MSKNNKICHRKEIIVIYLMLLAITFIKEADSSVACKLKECQEFGNFLKETMNRDVDPCDNFYDFVCSNRDSENYSSRRSQQMGIFDDRMTEIIKSDPQSTDPESLIKAKQIFNMCTGKLDDTGRTVLKSLLKEVGGWPLITHPRNSWNSETKLQDVLKFFDKYDINGALYQLEVTADRDEQYITLKRPPVIYADTLIMLDLLNYTLYDEKKTRFFLAFEGMLEYDIRNINQFINKLYGITLQNNTDVRMNISDLQMEYDKFALSYFALDLTTHINWLDVITNRYPINVTNQLELINVRGWSYFTQLAELLSGTDSRTIVNYVIWSFIWQMLPHVSEAAREIIEYPEWEHREFKCMHEEPNLKHAMNFAYAKLYSPTSTVAVRNIVNNVNTQLFEQLKHSIWMDIETKSVIQSTPFYLDAQIGVPNWYNDPLIDLYYKDLNIDENYLRTILNVLKFNVDVSRESFMAYRRNSTRRREFILKYPMETVEYDKDIDALVVPAGVISLSYIPGAPPAVNYGLLGSMVAAAMMEAITESEFDLVSRNNLRLSEEARRKFAEETDCLLSQYKNFEMQEIEKEMDDSRLALFGIKDAALSAAYQAYKKFTVQAFERRLWNLRHFSADQLFFISFASNFCESESDDYGPGRLRVSIPLSNMKEFSKAFNCPQRSPMNPYMKCTLLSN